MEDVKDKMKNLFKKANKPFSSSSSTAFKGQSHILGSSPITSSSSSTPSNSSSNLIKKSASAAGIFESPASCVGRFLSGQPAEESVEIAIKLLRNVAEEPGNEKFRKIRMGNLRIKEAVGEAEGGVELLECAGFRIEEEGGERWGRMAELTRERIDVIRELVLLLERSKGKDGDVVGNGGVGRLDEGKEREVKIIDRKVRVFFSVPESLAAKIDLPDSFYNASVEELRREADARKKKIADSQLLIPRSFKEKQAIAARKKYKLTVIRIQFPDGVVLQGVFLPSERTTVLYEFVSSALKDPTLEFELLSPAMARVHVIPRFPGADGRTPTLEEENLVPSVLIKFKPIETDSIVFTGLANEFLEVMEPLATATTVL